MKRIWLVRVLFLSLLPLILLFFGITSSTTGSQNVGGHTVYLPFITLPLPDQWIKNYDIPGADNNTIYHDLTLITDNDILFVGGGSDAQASDAIVTRTGSNGEPLWNKVFNTSGTERFFTTAQTLDGGLWVGGEFGQEGQVYRYPWLLRLDANGAVLWQKIYLPPTPSPYGSSIGKILATSDGGVLISIDDRGWSGVWIVKLTSGGTVSWVREFGGSSNWFSTVNQTLDGNYILAGTIMLNNEQFAWVVKINHNGVVLWQRAYGLSQAQDLELNDTFGLEVLNDGTYYLGVRARIDPINETWAIKILRINGNGGVIWQRSFDIDESRVKGMAVTQDQGLLVVGGDSYPSNLRPWVFKISNNGALLWKYIYGGVQGFNWPGVAYAVEVMSSGDIIIAGSESYFYGAGFMAMRLTAQGTIPYCNLLTDAPVTPVAAGLFEQPVNILSSTTSIPEIQVNIPSSTPTLQIQPICPQSAGHSIAKVPGQNERC